MRHETKGKRTTKQHWQAKPAPVLTRLSISDGAPPFQGDGPLLTTVTPNGDGYRDQAIVHFYLRRPALIGAAAQATQRAIQNDIQQPRWSVRKRFNRGWHRLVWHPSPSLTPATYVIVLSARSAGKTVVYGRLDRHSKTQPGPIVRLLSIDASFAAPSYSPGAEAPLTIATDAKGLTLTIIDVAGSAVAPTSNSLSGPDMIQPQHYDWRSNRDRPQTLMVKIGDWPAGVYFAAVSDDDGRVGYASLIVRATTPASRVAVLIPERTWAAYDFYDWNFDGFPDSWYDDGPWTVRLQEPQTHSGIPWGFYEQDWPLLRWLRLHGEDPDFISEQDLEQLSPKLSDDYALIIIPSHLEYATEAEYDALTNYRNRGGDLFFLSSDNLYWKVDVAGGVMEKVASWRSLGRPEAALVGAQYHGSKNGDQAYYTVGNFAEDIWAFAGTGLKAFDTFDDSGTEFDSRATSSPPETKVLAWIRSPDGHLGEMTYYAQREPNGQTAKVFDAGSFFSGSLLEPTPSRLLENLWNESDAPPLP
jgi:hypothetical protein